MANLFREDAAVVHIGDVGARMDTVRALESRGLVARISYDKLALTDDGWPVASLVAQVSGRRAGT